MNNQLSHYLSLVQKLQAICNYNTRRFVIDVFHQTEFRVLIEYLEDSEPRSAYFDFHENLSEGWYEDNIKNIKKIVGA